MSLKDIADLDLGLLTSARLKSEIFWC